MHPKAYKLPVLLMALCLFCTAALAQPTPEQRAQLEKLMDVATCKHERPKPVEPDAQSPVAAGRYFVLVRRIPDELKMHAGMLTPGIERFVIGDYAETTSEAYEKELEAAQAWIEEFSAAAALERGDIRYAGSFRDGSLAPDDPRRDLMGNLRKATRILRDDAVRLWVRGDRAKALERLASCVGVAGHTAEERFSLIAGLVAANEVHRVAELVTQMRVAMGDQPLPACERLKAAVAALDRKDPTRVRALYFDGARANMAFIEACTKDGTISNCLVAELAQVKAATEVFARMFDSLLDGKDPKAGLDQRELMKRLAEELGDLKIEEVRARHARAREELTRLEAQWDKEKPNLEVPDDDDDRAGIVRYVLGVPRVTHKTWAEQVEELSKLRAALGLPTEPSTK